MSPSESFVQDAPGADRPFEASAIESELRAMWKRAGGTVSPPVPEAPAGAIYRAALSNLVVPLDPSLATRLTPVLVDVTRLHPSRLFSVGAGSGPSGAGLRARIGAICHRRDTGGGLVCSEQVALDADEKSASLIPSAVRSLVIGDLPTVHLHFHPRLDLPWIRELMEMADLILVDSCLAPPGSEPEVWRFVEHLGSRRVHDLAWARLMPWRAILAEVFDEKEYLPSLRTVRRVEIGPPPPAWRLAGWLASRLGWKAEGGDRGGIVLRSGTGAVTMILQGTGHGEERLLERIRIQSGEPHRFEAEILHHGRERTASIAVRAPVESTCDVPFGYREFAACIVGEIHRHAPNRPMEAATRAAEDMMRFWREP